MNRVTLAERTTRLMNGRNTATRVAAALVAVAIAATAGLLLAGRVDDVKVELEQSQFFAQLVKQGEKSRIARILAEPEGSELLLRYANAIAVALTNLEQSPVEQLERFETIWAAQQSTGVAVTGFASDDAGTTLTIHLQTNDTSAQKFLEQIQENADFLQSILQKDASPDGQEYTITSSFPDMNL